MKISASIKQIYDNHEVKAQAIKQKIDENLLVWCRRQEWFYSSRVKQIESFAQKCQLSHIKKFDDVYAGTIVVKNRLEVKKCINLLLDSQDQLNIHYEYKRPEPIETAKNSPDSFVFDSVRLYFTMQDPYDEQPIYLEEFFEIQVKTLLDEAWEKVSHNFFYKTGDKLSWAKSRVMFQIKALLENAELAIAEAHKIASSEVLQKDFSELDDLNDVMDFYQKHWAKEKLPEDLRRLSESTLFLLKILNQSIQQLDELIISENQAGRGSNLLNLAPYWIVVSSYIKNLGWDVFLRTINEKLDGGRVTFPLITELEIPETINLDKYQMVRVLQ